MAAFNNDTFVGRNEEIAIFKERYLQVKKDISEKKNRYNVLNFNGVAGVGKTELIDKLIFELKNEIEPQGALYAYTQLWRAVDCHSFLKALRTRLVEKYPEFIFSSFDYAEYCYASLTGQNPAEEQAEKKKLTDNIFVEGITETLDILEDVPFAGPLKAALKLGKLGISFTQDMLVEHQDKVKELSEKNNVVGKTLSAINHLLINHQQEAKEISLCEKPLEIEEKLPVLFATDLLDNLKDKAVPLVVFIDAYDMLVNLTSINETSKEAKWLLDDVDGLIYNTQNVLWVISGRENVKINDEDEETVLNRETIQQFTPEDGKKYLELQGVVDKNLQERIYSFTEGHPLYMELCAKALAKRPDGNIDKLLNSTHDKLIEIFMEYMENKKQRQLVYMLAIMNQWDEHMVEEIGKEYMPGFDLSVYTDIEKLSFIKNNQNGKLTMDKSIAKALIAQKPEEFSLKSDFKDNVKKAVQKYLKEDIAAQNTLSVEYSVAVGQSLDATLQEETPEAILASFKENSENEFGKLIESGQYSAAEAMIVPLWESSQKYPGTELFAYANCEYARVLYRLAKYKKSEDLAQTAVDTFIELYSKKHDFTVSSMEILARNYRSMGKYKEALKLKQEIVELSKEILGKSNLTTIERMISLSECYRDLGRYDEALKIDKEVLEIYQNPDAFAPGTLDYQPKLVGFDDSDAQLNVSNTLSNIASNFDDLGEHQEALELRQKALEIHKTVLSEKHPSTLWKMKAVAESYRSLKRYKEAFEINKKILKLGEEILDNEDPDMLAHRIDLAMSYGDLGRYEDAQKLNVETMELCNKILSKKNFFTITCMRNLSCDYIDLEKYQEALDLRQELLELKKEFLSEEPGAVLSSMNDVAECYLKLGRYKEALELSTDAYLSYVEELGFTHNEIKRASRIRYECLPEQNKHIPLDGLIDKNGNIDVTGIVKYSMPSNISSMSVAAYDMKIEGKYKEACDKYREIIELGEKYLSKNHSIVVNAKENLEECQRLMQKGIDVVETTEKLVDETEETDKNIKNQVTKQAENEKPKGFFGKVKSWFS